MVGKGTIGEGCCVLVLQPLGACAPRVVHLLPIVGAVPAAIKVPGDAGGSAHTHTNARTGSARQARTGPRTNTGVNACTSTHAALRRF